MNGKCSGGGKLVKWRYNSTEDRMVPLCSTCGNEVAVRGVPGSARTHALDGSPVDTWLRVAPGKYRYGAWEVRKDTTKLWRIDNGGWPVAEACRTLEAAQAVVEGAIAAAERRRAVRVQAGWE